MALTKNYIQQVIRMAMKIVDTECSGIIPKGFYANFAPDEAWLTELSTYVGCLLKADGKISNDELNAFGDIFGKIPFGKLALSTMAKGTTLEDLKNIPYALPELISRDNRAIASGDDRISRSMWLYYIYFWVTVLLCEADGVRHPREMDISNAVLSKMHDDICNGLRRAPEENHRILESLLYYEGLSA